LGLKKLSFAKRDWREISYLIEAFQTVNDVLVEFELRSVITDGCGDLWLSATAYTNEAARVARAPLGSVQYSAMSTELTTMNSLFINALYRLDARLAEASYEELIKKP